MKCEGTATANTARSPIHI